MRGRQITFPIDSQPVMEGRQGKMQITLWLLLLYKIVIISTLT